MTEVITNNNDMYSYKQDNSNVKQQENHTNEVVKGSSFSDERSTDTSNRLSPINQAGVTQDYYHDRLDRSKSYRVKELCQYTVEEVVAYLYNCQVKKQHTQINNTYRKKQEPVPEGKYHSFIGVNNIVYDCRTEYLNKAIKNLCVRASNLMNRSNDLEYLMNMIKTYAKRKSLAVSNDVLVYNNKINKLKNLFKGLKYPQQIEAFNEIVGLLLKDSPPSLSIRLNAINEYSKRAVNILQTSQGLETQRDNTPHENLPSQY